jgi:hypothetical protein
VRLLADPNVAPRTVEFLRSLAYDVVRVDALLAATAGDAERVEAARVDRETLERESQLLRISVAPPVQETRKEGTVDWA